MTQLSEIKDENQVHLKNNELQMKKILQLQSSSQSLQPESTLKSVLASSSNSRLGKISARLSLLMAQQQEYLLRKDFYNRLTLQIETQSKALTENSPIQDRIFFSQILNAMTTHEANAKKRDASMWKFLSELTVALKSYPEPYENLLSFIENYVEFSSIANPQEHHQFAQQRHYSNGKLSVTAHPMNADEVGSVNEKQLEALDRIRLEQKSP